MASFFRTLLLLGPTLTREHPHCFKDHEINIKYTGESPFRLSEAHVSFKSRAINWQMEGKWKDLKA